MSYTRTEAAVSPLVLPGAHVHLLHWVDAYNLQRSDDQNIHMASHHLEEVDVWLQCSYQSVSALIMLSMCIQARPLAILAGWQYLLRTATRTSVH